MKYLGLLLLVPLVFVLTACGGNNVPEGEQVTYEDVEEIIAEDTQGSVNGSCSFLPESRCMDYIGSFWTRQQMELNCQGAGIFSTNTCPYPELGGCKTTGGTITEAVMWTYDAEGLIYQQGVCNANPMGEWVLPAYEASLQENQ